MKTTHVHKNGHKSACDQYIILCFLGTCTIAFTQHRESYQFMLKSIFMKNSGRSLFSEQVTFDLGNPVPCICSEYTYELTTITYLESIMSWHIYLHVHVGVVNRRGQQKLNLITHKIKWIIGRIIGLLENN